MKKLVSIVLALALVLAVAVASAATLTIDSKAPEGAIDKTTYTYYQIFKATIGSDATVNANDGTSTGGTASYYIDSAAMYTALTAANNGVFTITAVPGVDGRYNVTLVDGKTIDDILTVISNSAVKAAAFSTGSFVMDKSTRKAVKSDLDLGYYLIESSVGTTLAVQTLSDVEIKEKNDYFTDVKTEDTANVSVGDTVTYTITITIPGTVAVGDEITVHDTLDDRLAINANSIVAKIDNAGDAIELNDGTKKAETEDFAKKFTVTAAMQGHTVVFTYTATVLNTALTDTKFINTSFANDDNYETVPTQVKTYTFDFDLLKTFTGATGEDTNYTATFELSQGSTVFKFVQDASDAKKYTQDPTGGVSVLTIHNNETINVKGLKAGVYTLTEKSTSAGYNLLTEPITVEIIDDTLDDKKSVDTVPAHHVRYKLTADGSWVGDGENSTNNLVSVENNSGTTLPSTGGIGTTIFYIVGGILLVGAAIILVSRRKAHE